MPRPKKPKLKPVTLRLYAEDVRILKERATRDGASWHHLARLMLHRALQKREVVL